jgi:hypothetical protein
MKVSPLATVAVILLCLACGGGGGGAGSAPAAVSVALSPGAVSLVPGGTQAFTATVSNATTSTVTWSIQEGPSGGTITPAGLYTAPATVTATATFHVVATATADPSRSATAAVTVTRPADGTVTLSPSSVTFDGPAGQKVITATVWGSTQGVAWSLDETPPQGALWNNGFTGTTCNLTSFNMDGPAPNATWHLRATSREFPSSSAALAFTINYPVRVVASPANAVMGLSETRAFTATVHHTANTAVTWSVQEGAAGGVITAGGLYTAPSTPGVYHVVCTSAADPTKSSVCEVVVSGASGGSWAASGALSRPAKGNVSVLLANGKILVAGGSDPVTFANLSAAELYDPAAKASTPTGSMVNGRYAAAAALLPDGRVLVAGGGTFTAEIYNPATGQFTRTGDMSTPRTWAFAVALKDGKVLVVGGSQLKSAEVFDPATGQFTVVGSMSQVRMNVLPALLDDGRVLVAGGYNSSSIYADTAEVFDPATKAWSTVPGKLPKGCQGLASLKLPGGKVLLVGGQAGTNTGTEFYTQAALFDPATGAISATGSLGVARSMCSLAPLPGGKALAIGGSVADGYTGTCEIFDPALGVWVPGAPLNVARYTGFTVVPLMDGRVAMLGGWTAEGPLFTTASVEVFTP